MKDKTQIVRPSARRPVIPPFRIYKSRLDRRVKELEKTGPKDMYFDRDQLD